MDGFISQIQRLSTADGPGLRGTVVTVGCPLNCLWCPTPELIGDAAKFLYHPGRCVACGACVAQPGGNAICYFDAYKDIGKIMTEKEIAAELLEDKQHYDETGGGVTYTGGDAAMQIEFFYNLTTLLKQHDVHIALETSGHFPWDSLAPLIKAVDLIIYDIKLLNRHLHKRYTGVDNHLILDNALRIADMGKDMIARMLIVPGVNDNEAEINGRLRFIKNLGRNVKVEIMKYRKLDTEKYASLGMIEMMQGTPDCDDSKVSKVKEIAEAMGLDVIINTRIGISI